MIRYEMVLGIDLIDCLDCLASYDEGLSGTYRGALLVPPPARLGSQPPQPAPAYTSLHQPTPAYITAIMS